MPEPEIQKLIQVLERLAEEMSPKISLEQAILYLLVCTKENYPLTKLGEQMDWSPLKTYRQVSALATERYAGKEYYPGYELLYTQEDPESRIFKNAFLTHKGKELKAEIIDTLRKIPAKKH